MAKEIKDLTPEELQQLGEQMQALGIPLASAKEVIIKPDED